MVEEHESIEDDLEAFAGDVELAFEFAADDGARTFLHELPSFGGLVGHEGEMNRVLRERFGCNLLATRPVHEHFIAGTPGTAGEGQIQVSLFPTNNPQVFLAKYTYPDREITWAIRPLNVEE